MKPLRRRQPHPEIPLVSTADVSFLLLIFFLSTAIFTAERGIVLGLPVPGAPQRLVRPERIARVLVDAEHRVVLDGAVLPPGGLRNALVARRHAEPGLIVLLTVDPAAPYAALVEALDQVKLSGVRDITLKSGAPS
jgi:biopolymer transport protein ExbD